LRAGKRELIAYQGNEGRNRLAVGEVDEVNQCKNSEQTNLIGSKRNAFE